MNDTGADDGLRMLVDRLEFALTIMDSRGGTVDWGGMELDIDTARRWYRANVLRL